VEDEMAITGVPGSPHSLLSRFVKGGLMAMAGLWETWRSMAALVTS